MKKSKKQLEEEKVMKSFKELVAKKNVLLTRYKLSTNDIQKKAFQVRLDNIDNQIEDARDFISFQHPNILIDEK